MATIYIGPTSANPSLSDVKHGETVEFVLVDRTDTVTVTFVNHETPLVQNVNGSLTDVPSITLSPSLTQQSYPVAPHTLKKKYPFTFPKAGPILHEHDPDQPTASGEIDVTTDPEG